MTEIKRLEMLVKHYEDKEKKLIEWIKEHQRIAKANKCDNYTINLAWGHYEKALMSVLKQMEVLERVK